MNLFVKSRPFQIALVFALLSVGIGVYMTFAEATSAFPDEEVIENSSTKPHSMLLTLLEDAEYEESRFSIKASITTSYIAEHAEVYLYSRSENTVQKVLSDYDVKANIIDFSFFAKPSKEAYAIVHLTYGPNFLFERYSEAICIVPFLESNLFDSFDCDPLTTAEYLIAAASIGAGIDDIFSTSVIEEALYVKQLPRTITYEHFLSIHQMLFAHVAETTGYLLANQNGQYLPSMLGLSKALSDKVSRLRRLNISMLDKEAEKIDKSMVNLTYRIYMTLDGLLDRHAIRLEKLGQNNQLISDFFTGNSPFLLAGSETDIVVSVEYQNDNLQLNYWPWFDGIKVKFNNSVESFITNDRIIPIPQDATYVDITGQTTTGKYPTMRFSIAQKQDFERGLMGNSGSRDTLNEASQSELTITQNNELTEQGTADANLR